MTKREHAPQGETLISHHHWSRRSRPLPSRSLLAPASRSPRVRLPSSADVLEALAFAFAFVFVFVIVVWIPRRRFPRRRRASRDEIDGGVGPLDVADERDVSVTELRHRERTRLERPLGIHPRRS